jgi:hypothetical protein
VTTWDGARREQLRRWSALSLRQIIQAQEEMRELHERFAQARREEDTNSAESN